MKRRVVLLLAAGSLVAAAPAWSGNVDVGVNINVGAPPIPVPIIVPEPPLFLAPPTLGFSVAVGVPYDIVFIDGRYYAYHGNVWHVGPGYNGPWRPVAHDRLPPGLRKHKIKVIHECRDREYRSYQRERDHYRGRTYRPARYDRDDHHDHHNRHDHDRRDRDRDHDHGRGKGHGNGHGKGKWD